LNKKTSPPETKEWWTKINNWRKNHPLRVAKSPDTIKPQHLVKELSKATNGEAIVVADVGQHQMWAAQHYNFNHPRSYLSSGGLGTMGYGFPAAMGAAMAKPGRDVLCITGDGGFQMTAVELSTAVKLEVPAKIAITTNQCV